MEKKFKLGPLKKRGKKGKKLPVKSRPLSWPGLLLKNRTGSYQFLLQPAYSVQLPCYL